MSDAAKFDVPAGATSAVETVPAEAAPTRLAARLQQDRPDLELSPFCGTLTVSRFSTTKDELRSLLKTAGVFDLGWRARIRVTGEDQLRWLSGMVTNAVQQLPMNGGNYSFLLNAQGRIQGDAYVYREPRGLLLDTSVDQVEHILEHLERFIIMDDVELEDIQASSTTIGVAGPDAARILTACGVPVLTDANPIQLQDAHLHGIAITLITKQDATSRHFELVCDPADVMQIWQSLVESGATPCGIEAVEALRVLAGTPLYGVDLRDRDLPQETSQMHALNFNKGCYLGQEIVERIRSRGAVHKGLRQFALQGELPALPTELLADGVSIGQITSAAAIETPSGPFRYALGIVRTEALSRATALTYNGGAAVALERAPAVAL